MRVYPAKNVIQLREYFQFQGLNQQETPESAYLEPMPFGKVRSPHSSRNMEWESIYRCKSRPQLDVLCHPRWGLEAAKVNPRAINFNGLYL
jgi:hypothetical protein